MSIHLGTYDFFAHTISGGLHLFWMIYLFYYRLDLQSISLANISIVHLLIFAVAAYLVGIVTDPISRYWGRILRKERYYDKALKLLNQRNSHIEFQADKMDWFIILAYLRRQDLSMAEKIERLNATRIMLRNVSLNFFIFAIFAILEMLIGSSTSIFGGLSVVFMVMSFLSLRQADRYGNWFYSSIFQSVASFMLEKEQLPIKIKQENEASLQL